jgi:hypothetical protein
MKLLQRNSEEEEEYTFVHQVGSPDEAVELFYQRQESDAVSFLKFERRKNDYVELVINRNKDVYVYCVSGAWVFETQVPVAPGRRPFAPEDFIRSFCEGTHKEQYNFEKTEEEENSVVGKPQLTSHSKFGIVMLWPFFFIVAATFLMILLDQKKEKGSESEIIGILSLIAFVFTLPYHILLLQYFRCNGNSALAFSRKENLLTISRGNSSTSIRPDRITNARLVYKTAGRSFFSGFAYLILEAGPRDRAVITHFLYEDLEGLSKILKIKPKKVPSIYPLIALRRKSDADVAQEATEKQEKMNEFILKWSHKSREELQAIADSKGEYADYAVEAARQLLGRR